MTAPNHIAGGIAITGILASLMNINIFEKVEYVSIAVLFSLLPDIDLRSSIIAKIFLPVSLLVTKHFAHRTITHSAVFLFVVFLISYVLNYFLIGSQTVTYIVVFATISHFVLDMMTLQGLSLAYPFMPNRFVLPANPKMRIRTGDKQKELIFFTVFLLINFASIDLIKNGFWMNFNQSFGTLKHLHAQNKLNTNFLKCAYSFERNNILQVDTAFVISTTENNCVLYNHRQKRIIEVEKSDNYTTINYTRPLHSDIPKVSNYAKILQADIDSINQFMTNKIIIECEVNSTAEFIYHNEYLKKLKTSNLLLFESLFIREIEKDNTETQIKISEIRQKIKAINENYNENIMKYENIQDSIEKLSNPDESISNYLKTQYFEKVQELKKIKKPKRPKTQHFYRVLRLLKKEQKKDLFAFTGTYIPLQVFTN